MAKHELSASFWRGDVFTILYRELGYNPVIEERNRLRELEVDYEGRHRLTLGGLIDEPWTVFLGDNGDLFRNNAEGKAHLLDTVSRDLELGELWDYEDVPSPASWF